MFASPTASSNNEFRPRFRRGAFGWKSQPAVQRIREAVAEIKRVARGSPMSAAEGAVLFLEKVSPALEHVDNSSGALSAAVNAAIAELVPVIVSSRADAQAQGWLSALRRVGKFSSRCLRHGLAGRSACKSRHRWRSFRNPRSALHAAHDAHPPMAIHGNSRAFAVYMQQPHCDRDPILLRLGEPEWSRLGIEAKGGTTVLKINYRSRPFLRVALHIPCG